MQTRFRGQLEVYRYARTGDLDMLIELLADPRVGEWLWFLPAPASALRAYFRPHLDAQWEDLTLGQVPGRAMFIVEDREQHLLGMGAALPVAGSPGGFEIGFQLAAHAWGRGVGTRLAWFLAAWVAHSGEGVQQAYRIEANCLAGNLGSQRILTKLGLKREGSRADYRLKQGTRHSELLFGAKLAELDATRLRQVAADSQLEDAPSP